MKLKGKMIYKARNTTSLNTFWAALFNNHASKTLSKFHIPISYMWKDMLDDSYVEIKTDNFYFIFYYSSDCLVLHLCHKIFKYNKKSFQ